MAHKSHKVLLADPDGESMRRLARALRERGCQVYVCSDGSRALEIAVLRHPDVVVFDEACRLVDARTFVQILRTNPRTQELAVLVTGTKVDNARRWFHRDGYVVKPVSVETLWAHLEQSFRRAEAAREVKGDSKEIKGSLEQIGLPDLLQVLSMNRRTGRLALERHRERGDIYLSDGQPIDAGTGVTEGQKALFRLLTWTEGTFRFTAGGSPGAARIQRTMEEALLEGMRQCDEAAQLLERLPPPTARLALSPGAALAADQHPVTAQVLRLLAEPRPLSELIDRCPVTDLEAMAAIASLLEKGIARVLVQAAEAPEAAPVLGTAEQHALQSRLAQGRAALAAPVGKVLLCSETQARLSEFMEGLGGLAGFSIRSNSPRGALGTLGRLRLTEGLQIDLCALPPSDDASPLWMPFASGAIGVALLGAEPLATRLAELCARRFRVPVALLGAAELPPSLRALPDGAFLASGDPKEALRALLSAAARTRG